MITSTTYSDIDRYCYFRRYGVSAGPVTRFAMLYPAFTIRAPRMYLA
jgi:hypothetical protein